MLSTLKNYLIWTFLAGLSGVAMIFFVAVLIFPTLPNIDRLSEYRPKQPLKIYSSDGALIAEFGEERREYISISTVPQKMINAIISIEDRRFFEHPKTPPTPGQCCTWSERRGRSLTVSTENVYIYRRGGHFFSSLLGRPVFGCNVVLGVGGIGCNIVSGVWGSKFLRGGNRLYLLTYRY